MKITSSYHKTLHCQVGNKSIGIEPNQVLIVEDDFGEALIKNSWIGKVSGRVAPTPIHRSEILYPICAMKSPVPCIKKPIEKKEELIEKKEVEKPIEEKVEKVIEKLENQSKEEVIEKKEEIIEIKIPKKKNPIKRIKVDKNYLKD